GGRDRAGQGPHRLDPLRREGTGSGGGAPTPARLAAAATADGRFGRVRLPGAVARTGCAHAAGPPLSAERRGAGGSDDPGPVPQSRHRAIRRDEARHPLRRRRATRVRRRSGRRRVHAQRGRPACGQRSTGGPARGLVCGGAEVPHAAGLAGGGAAGAGGPGGEQPRRAGLAAAPPAALEPALAQGLRRCHAGVGRSGFAAESRRAGTIAGAAGRAPAHRAPPLRRCGRRPGVGRIACTPRRCSDPRGRADRTAAREPCLPVEVMMDRRDFLRTMCYGGLATFGFPVVNFARVRQSGRFVFVLLRGGFDGLAAVVPYADPAYRALRGALAFETDELVLLDDAFGLAPGLAPLREFWERNELVVLHAMAIPYRTRSHFDGQAVLETGLDRPIGSSDGWLNRLLQVMPGERAGIAIASG